MLLKVGILTASDRASQGVYEDISGQELEAWFKSAVTNELEIHRRIVPDEFAEIEKSLIELTDKVSCQLVLTTGGTGPAPRDVTPDVTVKIADRVMDGFGERMRQISLNYVPTAILSRQVGAIRGKSLIINLPGQPKSIRQTLDVLFEAIPYCVELISGFIIETSPSVKAFRPKKS